MKRADIIASARKTVGTPWAHHGRRLRLGLDCIGVAQFLLTDLDLPVYDVPYQRHAHWHDFLAHFRKHAKEIDIRDARPGDVLVFRYIGPYPCHCGIYADKYGGASVIHSRADWEKCVEEPYSNALRRMTRAAFVLPGVED